MRPPTTPGKIPQRTRAVPWRRVRRFAARALGAVVGLFLLVLGGLMWWASTWRPTVAVDYEAKWRELRDSTQPPLGENAADLLAAMNAECDALCDHVERGSPLWKAMVFSAIADPTYQPKEGVALADLNVAIRAAVEKHAASPMPALWGRLRSATHVSGLAQGVAMFDMVLPEMTYARRLNRLCTARMHLAAERGDWGEFVGAYEDGLALARLMSGVPMVIPRLVACAASVSSERELLRTLAEFSPGPEVVEALAAARARQAWTVGARPCLEGERLIAMDIVQRTHTDLGGGTDGVVILSTLKRIGDPAPIMGVPAERFGWINLAGVFMTTRRSTAWLFNRYIDSIAAEVDTPVHSRSTDYFITIVAIGDHVGQRSRVFSMGMISAGNVLYAFDSERTVRAAAGAALEIERARARTGRLPASIEGLGDAVVDPMTGLAFGYEPSDGGTAYRLYSFGQDRIDNGGRQAPNDGMDALRRRKADGFDCVLNEPRPGRGPTEVGH